MSSSFKSIDEFRAALNGLIGSTEKRGSSSVSSRVNRSRPPRRSARLNAGFLYKDETGTYRDSWSGLDDIPESKPKAAKKPAREPRATPVKAARVKETKAPAARKGRVYNDPYAKIGASVGGPWRICPGLDFKDITAAAKAEAEATGREKINPSEWILRKAGLTDAKAQAVLAALDAAGVLSHGSGRYRKSRVEQQKAMEILATVGGITCPMGAGFTGYAPAEKRGTYLGVLQELAKKVAKKGNQTEKDFVATVTEFVELSGGRRTLPARQIEMLNALLTKYKIKARLNRGQRRSW